MAFFQDTRLAVLLLRAGSGGMIRRLPTGDPRAPGARSEETSP